MEEGILYTGSSKVRKGSYLEDLATAGPLVGLPEWLYWSDGMGSSSLPLEPFPQCMGPLSVVHGLLGQVSGCL